MCLTLKLFFSLNVNELLPSISAAFKDYIFVLGKGIGMNTYAPGPSHVHVYESCNT